MSLTRGWLRSFPSLAGKADAFLDAQLDLLSRHGVDTAQDLENVTRDSLKPYIAALVLEALKPEKPPPGTGNMSARGILNVVLLVFLGGSIFLNLSATTPERLQLGALQVGHPSQQVKDERRFRAKDRREKSQQRLQQQQEEKEMVFSAIDLPTPPQPIQPPTQPTTSPSDDPRTRVNVVVCKEDAQGAGSIYTTWIPFVFPKDKYLVSIMETVNGETLDKKTQSRYMGMLECPLCSELE